MSTKKSIILSALLVICVLFLIFLSGNRKKPITVKANDSSLSSTDEIQIKAVIQLKEELTSEAKVNGGDVSRFPEVFVNFSNDYPLNEDQLALVEDVLGLDATKNAGMLTVMQAQYKVLGEGSALLQESIDKAKLEKREINREELDELVKKNHGVQPPAPFMKDSMHKVILNFESIEVLSNEKAVARVYDGLRLIEYILVKIDGRWLISGGKTLRIDA